MKINYLIVALFITSFLLSNATNISYKIKGIEIVLVQDNILNLKVDAIVNAANKNLEHGGGICDVIHKAAGPELEKECLKYPLLGQDTRCYTGQAVITKGYNLKNCKSVIHAVGPDWRASNTSVAPVLLGNAYLSSLELADKNKLSSIAFPAISVGIFAFPPKKATEIAVKTIANFDYSKSYIKKIYFVVYNDNNLFEFYKNVLEKYDEKYQERLSPISKL